MIVGGLRGDLGELRVVVKESFWKAFRQLFTHLFEIVLVDPESIQESSGSILKHIRGPLRCDEGGERGSKSHHRCDVQHISKTVYFVQRNHGAQERLALAF